MDLADYLVTLCIRPADLSGLKELPGKTKDNLTPLILLAPWMGKAPLSRALDKFEDAYPRRPYFVDVDTYYQPGKKQNDATDSWDALANRPADLGIWCSLLSDYPNANPCLLMAGVSLGSARQQIQWARENNRTFCLRMNMAPGVGSGIPAWMPNLIAELSGEGAVDYIVVLDFGQVKDALDIAAQADGCAKHFAGIPPAIPLVICCTSFPNDFADFDGTGKLHFSNRALLSQIRLATNHPRIVYGDWGSTKPRAYDRASPPKNRIDYPTADSWVFARDKDGSISFQIAAQRIKKDQSWCGHLGIWGEKLIEAAASGQAPAITSMPKMYAARINIHLHLQAFYGQLPSPEELDEEWLDEPDGE